MPTCDFNLARDAIFPVNDGVRRRWMSLPELLTLDIAARIDHPVSALNTPLMMLVVALTQHQQDAVGGVRAREIQVALTKACGFSYPWLSKPIPDGLGMFDEGAFMQVPDAWVIGVKSDAAAKKPKPNTFEARKPEGLFKPFRLGSAKGLRLPLDRINAICPACASVALFLKNSFTAPMSQYWGRSAVAGSLVVLHQAVKGRAYDLPLSVALNLSAKKPDQVTEVYPWHAGENSLIDAICAPAEQKLFRSASLLPMVRAQRLIAPTETGTCDCCGRHAQALVTQYYEIGEKTLFAALPDPARELIAAAAATAGGMAGASMGDVDNEEGGGKKKGAYAGAKILALMYADFETRRHPNLPYVMNKDGKRVSVIHSNGIGEATHQAPTWTRLTEIFGKNSLDTTANFLSTDANVRGLKAAVAIRIAQQLYTIVPENGTNPGPKYIADDTYSLLYANDSVHTAQDIGAIVSQVALATRELIDVLVSSIANLFKEIEIGEKTIGLRASSAKSLNPIGNAKRLVSIRTAATQLWDDAFTFVNQAAVELRNCDPEDIQSDPIIADKIARLEAVAKALWKMIEKTEFSGPSDARDLYLQARASKEFHKQMTARQPRAVTHASPNILAAATSPL